MRIRTILMRHGDYGHYASMEQLNHGGIEQVVRTTDFLATQNLGNVALFSSEAPRAYQSAEIVEEGLNISSGVILTRILAEDFDDENILSKLDEALLKEDGLETTRRINTVIAVSHAPTIARALRLGAFGDRVPEVIEHASIHEYIRADGPNAW